MNASRDCAQATRAMIDRVHRGNSGAENLRRADVTRGFIAADVLLTRLQCEAISWAAFGIVRNPDQTSGHVTLVLVTGGKVGRMRPTVSEGHAQTLRVAHRDIGAEFSRWFQERQCKKIRSDNDQRASIVRLPNEFAVIIDRAVRGGILDKSAKNSVLEFEAREIADDEFDTERFRAGAHDCNSLRVTIVCNEENFPARNSGVTK